MSGILRLGVLGLAGLLSIVSSARGQTPYIGFVYPAGGQQGQTFQVRLGGQRLDGLSGAVVSGSGVSVKIVDYQRRLNPQETRLLREQLTELTRRRPAVALASATKGAGRKSRQAQPPLDEATRKLIDKIQKRMADYVNRPACVALADIAIVEVTVSPSAEPGEREIRLVTPRGLSNPMAFHVGQVPEVARKPMKTAEFQVLGKEELAQRKRPEEEVEARVKLPCTMNGQIASGEVNRYRFEARKGQRLVISVKARELVPYIADAVPGWFQPVLALYDAAGKEVAYVDDYRFKPDPVLYFEVPKDGEYVLAITDAIFRGREDFIYRMTVSELPFVTSIFPLGGRVGEQPKVAMNGWNIDGARLTLPEKDAGPGVHLLTARKDGKVSNPVPFALDTLPEDFDKESNDDPQHAQKVTMPLILNGRIDRRDDWDVFQVEGRAGDTIVAEVTARRLDSPLDSLLKITDASGKVIAFNDDYADAGSGLNTHHADSYVMAKLPADGKYFVHLGDVARSGGPAYGYRLRISAPRPDFALRTAPSSGVLRSRSSGTISVYAIRKDGFAGPITLGLKNPPQGFSASSVTLSPSQDMTRLSVRTTLAATKEPVALHIEGRATVGKREIVREAVPSEDRMQAFLWRHLLPAQELKALVYNPSDQASPRRARVAPTPAKPETAKTEPAKTAATTPAPKFTKQQVAGRLRQLKLLYDEGLLTDAFYDEKVAECEAM